MKTPKPQLKQYKPGHLSLVADGPVMKLRVEIVREAQQRARIALFICTVATGTVLAGLWNSYFAWDRPTIAKLIAVEKEQAAMPTNATPEQKAFQKERMRVADQTYKSWWENQLVSLPLFGVRFSMSDVAVIGSTALIVLAFYYQSCVRRANLEVGGLLRDASLADPVVKDLAFYAVQSTMVLNTLGEFERPIDSLKNDNLTSFRKIGRGRHWAFQILTYLPAATIGLILLSDAYFAFFYASAWRQNTPPVWAALSSSYKIQLASTEIYASLAGVIAYMFCRSADRHQSATRLIFQEFEKGFTSMSESRSDERLADRAGA